jgi:hypothetical protein
MTEREAWLRIADTFVDENKAACGVYHFGGYPTHTICHCIYILSSGWLIDFMQERRMKAKAMFEVKRRGRHVHIAPFTDEGAKVRREFCLKQAELLKEQEVEA